MIKYEFLCFCLLPTLFFGDDLQSLGFDATGVSTVTVGATAFDLGSPNPQNAAVETSQKKQNNSNVHMVLGVYEGGGVMIYQQNGSTSYYSADDGYYPAGVYGPMYGYGMPISGPNPIVDYDTVPAYYQTPYYENMMR